MRTSSTAAIAASASRKNASNAGVEVRPLRGVSVMRTALCLAIGVAIVAGGVPASFAQDSPVPDPGKPAGTGIEAKERQKHQGIESNKGISLAEPIGKVSVGHG